MHDHKDTTSILAYHFSELHYTDLPSAITVFEKEGLQYSSNIPSLHAVSLLACLLHVFVHFI